MHAGRAGRNSILEDSAALRALGMLQGRQELDYCTSTLSSRVLHHTGVQNALFQQNISEEATTKSTKKKKIHGKTWEEAGMSFSKGAVQTLLELWKMKFKSWWDHELCKNTKSDFS